MDKLTVVLTITLLFTLIIVSAFSFILGKETTITTMAVLEKEVIPSEPEFKAYTEAVCEEKDFYKECTDTLVVECGNTKHHVSIVDGSAGMELN